MLQGVVFLCSCSVHDDTLLSYGPTYICAKKVSPNVGAASCFLDTILETKGFFRGGIYTNHLSLLHSLYNVYCSDPPRKGSYQGLGNSFLSLLLLLWTNIYCLILLFMVVYFGCVLIFYNVFWRCLVEGWLSLNMKYHKCREKTAKYKCWLRHSWGAPECSHVTQAS